MRAATIAVFAIVGWAVCAATIGIGFTLMTEREALVLHAIVAPIAFAGLSWLYFTRFAYTPPLATALLFLAIVVALDVFVVALFIEKKLRDVRKRAGNLGAAIPNFRLDLGDGRCCQSRKAGPLAALTAHFFNT